MVNINPKIHQLHQSLPNPSKPQAKNSGISFKDVLHDVQNLTISKHANERLENRNISIDEKKWQQISEKMIEAKKKGVTDSLVVTNDAALVVSTKNHTVVTAMARDEASAKIFTNINGTIVMND